MTTVEWDATDDVNAMLERVRGHASDRKLLLFACGCCRLAESTVPVASYLADRFERDSNRPLSRDEKTSMFSLVASAVMGDLHPIISRVLSGCENDSWSLANNVASLLRRFSLPEREEPVNSEPNRQAPPPVRSAGQAEILREIVINPGRSLDFSGWRTETTIGIARGIEAEAAWDRMPILADALQDAGCENSDILDHCRASSSSHRPGCWVLDAVLDRP
jgi:hypothetical protein